MNGKVLTSQYFDYKGTLYNYYKNGGQNTFIIPDFYNMLCLSYIV